MKKLFIFLLLIGFASFGQNKGGPKPPEFADLFIFDEVQQEKNADSFWEANGGYPFKNKVNVYGGGLILRQNPALKNLAIKLNTEGLSVGITTKGELAAPETSKLMIGFYEIMDVFGKVFKPVGNKQPDHLIQITIKGPTSEMVEASVKLISPTYDQDELEAFEEILNAPLLNKKARKQYATAEQLMPDLVKGIEAWVGDAKRNPEGLSLNYLLSSETEPAAGKMLQFQAANNTCLPYKFLLPNNQVITIDKTKFSGFWMDETNKFLTHLRTNEGKTYYFSQTGKSKKLPSYQTVGGKQVSEEFTKKPQPYIEFLDLACISAELTKANSTAKKAYKKMADKDEAINVYSQVPSNCILRITELQNCAPGLLVVRPDEKGFGCKPLTSKDCSGNDEITPDKEIVFNDLLTILNKAIENNKKLDKSKPFTAAGLNYLLDKSLQQPSTDQAEKLNYKLGYVHYFNNTQVYLISAKFPLNSITQKEAEELCQKLFDKSNLNGSNDVLVLCAYTQEVNTDVVMPEKLSYFKAIALGQNKILNMLPNAFEENKNKTNTELMTLLYQAIPKPVMRYTVTVKLNKAIFEAGNYTISHTHEKLANATGPSRQVTLDITDPQGKRDIVQASMKEQYADDQGDRELFAGYFITNFKRENGAAIAKRSGDGFKDAVISMAANHALEMLAEGNPDPSWQSVALDAAGLATLALGPTGVPVRLILFADIAIGTTGAVYYANEGQAFTSIIYAAGVMLPGVGAFANGRKIIQNGQSWRFASSAGSKSQLDFFASKNSTIVQYINEEGIVFRYDPKTSNIGLADIKKYNEPKILDVREYKGFEPSEANFKKYYDDFVGGKLSNTKSIVTSKLSNKLKVNLTGFVCNTNDDFIDLVVHSDNGNYKAIVEQGKSYTEKLLTNQDLADLINGLPGSKAVRLLSCSDLASANDLSKLINGRELYASDGWVDLFQDGSLASQNSFKKLVNGVEKDDIGKYSSSSSQEKVRLGDEAIAKETKKVFANTQELVEDIVKKRGDIKKNIQDLPESKAIAREFFNKNKSILGTDDFHDWFENGFKKFEKGTVNFEAHHVVPINVLETNDKLQELLLWANKNGKDFDFNAIDNGIMLQKKSLGLEINGHTVHNDYNRAISEKITEIISNPRNVGKPERALDELKNLILSTKAKLKSEVLLGSKDVNNIIDF